MFIIALIVLSIEIHDGSKYVRVVRSTKVDGFEMAVTWLFFGSTPKVVGAKVLLKNRSDRIRRENSGFRFGKKK